jgi:(E)-4-hydroxy-3-methylbut-2-enyl-diphosphate synthase
MIERRKTKQIQLGKVKVGGDAPITVQSMTKTDTRDVKATVQQIWSLEAAGCEIVRCAVPVREAAEQLGEIKKRIRIPLVADIHFNYKLALIAIEQGVEYRSIPARSRDVKGVQEAVVENIHVVDLSAGHQLAGLVSDVADIQGQRPRDLALESEVEALDIRGP